MLQYCFCFKSKKPTGNRFFRLATQLLFFIMLCAVITVNAADDDLSLPEAIQRSLDEHPDLKSFQYRFNSADGNIQQAGQGSRPELALTLEDGLGTGKYSGSDNLQSTLSITWVVEGELLSQRTQTAGLQKQLILVDQQIKKLDVAAETAQRFLTLLVFQQRQALVREAKIQAQSLVDELSKRLEAGKSLLADKLRADVELAKTDIALEDISHEIKSAKRQLTALWNQRQTDFVAATGSLNLSDQLIDIDAMSEVLVRNPQVRRFLTQERVAQAEINLAKADARTRWQFSTGIRRFEDSDDYAFTAGISIPLGGQQRNQGQIRALQAKQGHYRANADALQIKLEAQLFVLAQEFQHAQHVAHALEEIIIPTLRVALKESQRAYQLGKHSYQEWRAIQQELLSTRSQLLDTQFKAHLNRVEIERLTGLAMTNYSEEKR